MAERCCDLHNRNCEPPGDLCCHDCTEYAHPLYHPPGVTCIAPDLSAPLDIYAEIRAERESHSAKGWTAEHDREHGLSHLTGWSSYYSERRQPVTRENLIKAASLLVAAIDLLDSEGTTS